MLKTVNVSANWYLPFVPGRFGQEVVLLILLIGSTHWLCKYGEYERLKSNVAGLHHHTKFHGLDNQRDAYLQERSR